MIDTIDRYYKEQNIYDLEIVSTLGLTNDDLNEIAKIDEIDQVEGTYEKDAIIENNNEEIVVKLLCANNINVPVVLEGNLPINENECVVEEIFLKTKNKKIGDGFTSGHNRSTSIMCGDGIERPNLIARICTNKNNALDIYNIAHEFTHILLNENTKGKNISAENQEIATRFTEILLGEYMEKRKIITTEDKENHNICISGEIDKAYQLNEYRILRNLIKNNGNKFDKKLEKTCISKYCKGNKNWYYQILSNIAYRLERTGKVDGFQNYLRFVNSAAECDRLKQAYIENPDLIKKAFSQCLMSHHSITYNDVVKKMDTIKYEDRAKLNIASKGRDEVEEQDIIR